MIGSVLKGKRARGVSKRLGKQTVAFQNPPWVAAGACVVGKKEGEGPLAEWFNVISQDSYFGEKSWEKAESTMLRQCFALCCDKAKTAPSDLHGIFAGDLLNQCVSSSFAARDTGVPFFGLYGACSTMAEGLTLAAMVLDGGFAETVCAMTSSHFCSAERQYRLPLEYGGQRTPTSQWTVTGAGALILKNGGGSGAHITHATAGRIVDAGIADMNNMGAAMAPAALDTLTAHFADTGRSPQSYDAVITGDLGQHGHNVLMELFRQEGLEFSRIFTDCGVLIYSPEQDTHCGGSGCGCSASVLAGYILHQITEGEWNRVLFAATGALMSPTTAMQGETIPAICHAVAIENMREV
ncbi:MAG: stage V sporulation protein AD [Oscillospiraceae bacterium]|nr:stage V sporulation protein AD [Oscillospiraceae bacterium]